MFSLKPFHRGCRKSRILVHADSLSKDSSPVDIDRKLKFETDIGLRLQVKEKI